MVLCFNLKYNLKAAGQYCVIDYRWIDIFKTILEFNVNLEYTSLSSVAGITVGSIEPIRILS